MTVSMLAELEARRARLLDRLAVVGDFRRGSISENWRRCGKPSCRRCAEPGSREHGSRWLWTRTVPGRGTIGRQLRAEELRKVRAEVENYQQFAALAEEIAEVSEAIREAFELRAERARYEASRAERAFHLCEPENRLVARSLEQRWEAKLAAVAEAEAAVEAQRAQRPPLPPKAELATLAADLRRLWNEPTTSPRDRKRVLRTLITDVTLTSDPVGDEIRVGIRSRAGACEEQIATRTRMRTGQEAVQLVRRRKLEGLRDTDIAAELRALGLRTARGNQFGTRDLRNVRHSIGLARPSPLQPGELTVSQVAARLGVKPGTVYYWLRGRPAASPQEGHRRGLHPLLRHDRRHAPNPARCVPAHETNSKEDDRRRSLMVPSRPDASRPARQADRHALDHRGRRQSILAIALPARQRPLG